MTSRSVRPPDGQVTLGTKPIIDVVLAAADSTG
jgi:hypothetical protein